jgi:iron complex outermembrane receptor protein
MATSVASAALAQAAPPPTPPGGGGSGHIEEIVVTARKTGEALQKTPVAVTALSAKAMATKQIVAVNSLQATVPGLTILGAGNAPSSVVYLAIRGQAQNSPNSATDAAVGIYVDGVYIARPLVSNLGFIDIQHLEVLRGPQGTLFGRNTIGGALSVTTNQPTDRFEGWLQAGYGNYNDAEVQGVVNVPIVPEQLAARAAFQYESHDAYYLNGNTGAAAVGAVDANKLKYDYTGRVELLWTPTAAPLKANLSFDFTSMADSGVPEALVGVNTGLFGPLLNQYLVTNGNNYYKTFANPQTPQVPAMNTGYDLNKAYGISLNLDYDLGRVHLKSITAYRGSDTENAEDLDGTPAGAGAFISLYQEHQFSQEIQASTHVGKFDMIGGAYYFYEDGTEYSADSVFYANPGFLGGADLYPGFPDGPIGVGTDFSNFTSASTAVFGQFNYHITDRLRFTAGLRWTWDSRGLIAHGRDDAYDAYGAGPIPGIQPTNPPSIEFPFDGPKGVCAVGAPPGTPGTTLQNGGDFGNPTGPCNNRFQASWNYPAWTAGFDFQATDNVFLYAKTSKADMAGSFNTRAVPFGVSPAVNPSSNMDVEIGAKTEWFDHHLRANIALFTAWQQGVVEVVNTLVGTTLTQYAINAGNTTTQGGELEVTLLPWQGGEVDLAGSYLNAQYVKGSFHDLDQAGLSVCGVSGMSPCPITAPGVVAGQSIKVDRSGETVPQAPKFTYSIGATQTFHLPVGPLSVHLDYEWIDSTTVIQGTALPVADGNSPGAIALQKLTNQLGVLPSYGLLNARIALDLYGSRVELALWGRNLTGEEYYTQMGNFLSAFGTAVDFQGNPRTVGGTITYHW